MINFDFTLDNPFHLEDSKFSTIYAVNKRLSENKTFECEVYRLSDRAFEFGISIHPRFQDHGGYVFSFGILSVIIELSIRDNRHWNHETNDWMNYETK